MKKKEAKQIISVELEQYKAKPHSELAQMIDGEPIIREKSGPSGKNYQIEIHVFWDDTLYGNIRVMGSIDDGGWRSFVPLNDSFIKTPLNELIGE